LAQPQTKEIGMSRQYNPAAQDRTARRPFGPGRRLQATFLASTALAGAFWASSAPAATAPPAANVYTTPLTARQVKFGSVMINGLNITYREAGDPKSPKLVLLPGFPASSHQYRDLIKALADKFHVIAPDYVGFGPADQPDPAKYSYTFDNLTDVTEKLLAARGFDHFGIFAQDYGGPVAFRMVTHNPAILDWLIIQNTNAYEEGFTEVWAGLRGALWQNRSPESEKPLEGFLTHDAIKGIYLHGSPHPELMSPDNWETDYGYMQRPYSVRLNLDLFYDYRKNVELYPQWQRFLREHQPKTLIFWGEDDIFFTPAGGEAYLRDLPKAEMHRLAAGHFAVEDNLDYIAATIRKFYDQRVAHKG
jgi:pimeloyl-ACP methyl ester carboxylesterase